MPETPSTGRLIAAAALVSVPVWTVLLVLLAFGGVTPGAAAVLALAAPAGAALVLRRPLGRIAGLTRSVGRLAGGEPARLSDDAGDGGPLGELNAALRRFERTRLADQASVGERLEAAERMLDALPDPLLRIDHQDRIRFANKAAEDLLGSGDGGPQGRQLATVLRQPEVLEAVAEAAHGGGARTVTFAMAGQIERRFEAWVDGVVGPGEGEVRAVLVLRDSTAAHRTERLHADFIANVSHELRMPLSTLVGFIEMLLGPARDDPPARTRFLALMQTQAGRMARLVDDLLSLSRIELEEHTPPRERIDLADVVRQTADLLTLEASRKDMTIEVAVAPDLPPVRGDPDQLTQLFQNLIDNAIKYGRAGTPIRIAVAPDPAAPHRIVATVANAGEGIPREHLPRLTERFYRVDTARSRELGGTGLGLAIVKHIVSRHRGRLRADSTPGEGTTFAVHLPVDET